LKYEDFLKTYKAKEAERSSHHVTNKKRKWALPQVVMEEKVKAS
jgi:hypothetical protein